MRSVKANYILNLINTATQILFPLLTFPYASRIMQPEGIGTVSFLSSITSYISIFTCLGIPMYAIREIARTRNDIQQMNKTAVEIILLHMGLTFIGYIVVALLCLFAPKIQTNIPLFLILSSSILFTTIGCEWFYQGIEDFLYVTVRGIIIKILAIIFLFLFVKDKDDILLYASYTVFGVLGGNIFNFFRLRKYIKKEYIIFSELKIIRHIKPTLSVFTFSIITSLYLQLNPLLLGILKNQTEVGYFVTSTKLMDITLRIFYCFSAVLMPHISNLIAEKKEKEFKILAQKAYDFSLATTIPLTIILIFTSPYAIKILAGDAFKPAILSAQILSLNIIFVGLSQVMGYQILYPMGKLKIVLKSTAIGAATNIIVNLLCVPHMAHYGTALAFISAEFATTASMMIIGKKYLPIILFCKNHYNYITGGLITILFLLFIQNKISLNDFSMIAIIVLMIFITYFGFLFTKKDKFVLSLIEILKKSVQKSRNNKFSSRE